jgi:hypothetical protein
MLWIKLGACESVIEGYAGATNGRVACGAGRVYSGLDKCWLMSLIDILGTLSMKDVVERDHGHTTTHHPPPDRYEAEARPC